MRDGSIGVAATDAQVQIPIVQQLVLKSSFHQPLAHVGFDFIQTFAPDIVEMGADAVKCPSAAGNLDHDFRGSTGCPCDGGHFVRGQFRLWAAPTEAGDIEQGSLRAQVNDSFLHDRSPSWRCSPQSNA